MFLAELACCFLVGIAYIFNHIKLGANFCCRSFSDRQEADKITVGLAVKTFGDVGHDRDSSTAELITKPVIVGKLSLVA